MIHDQKQALSDSVGAVNVLIMITLVNAIDYHGLSSKLMKT